MRHTIIATLVAAGALLGPAQAMAQASSEGEVTINGSVADRCLFTVPSKIINLGELALSGSGGTAGRLDASKVEGATETLEGWCNGTAATMTVEAQPIENTSFTAAPPAGFDRVVNYTATATANGVPGTDSSSVSGSGTPVSVGMFTGAIPVVLSEPSSPTGGILVAGDYQGLVQVTLTPNTSFGTLTP